MYMCVIVLYFEELKNEYHHVNICQLGCKRSTTQGYKVNSYDLLIINVLRTTIAMKTNILLIMTNRIILILLKPLE